MRTDSRQIAAIADRALAGLRPTPAEIKQLLAVDDPVAAAPLFAAARAVRERQFGDAVFVYGFVYFSTWCRNDCAFCLYRRGNPRAPRYRKSLDEVVSAAVDLVDGGAHLIDLTMGEDPMYFAHDEFEPLIEVVAAVKQATGAAIMISPGVVPGHVLAALHEAGADWYACYQESHAATVFGALRMGQSFDQRVAARAAARRCGLLVEDGMLLGAGETVADRALSVTAMADEDLHQVRVMTFVPQAGTPLAGQQPEPFLHELVTVATLRLTMPDRLIPASLDVDGIRGLEPRIDAGANVVTSIVPPYSGLAGVSQATLDIDEGLRTVAEVRARLARLGLTVAARAGYDAWLEHRAAPAGRPGAVS